MIVFYMELYILPFKTKTKTDLILMGDSIIE